LNSSARREREQQQWRWEREREQQWQRAGGRRGNLRRRYRQHRRGWGQTRRYRDHVHDQRYRHPSQNNRNRPPQAPQKPFQTGEHHLWNHGHRHDQGHDQGGYYENQRNQFSPRRSPMDNRFDVRNHGFHPQAPPCHQNTTTSRSQVSNYQRSVGHSSSAVNQHLSNQRVHPKPPPHHQSLVRLYNSLRCFSFARAMELVGRCSPIISFCSQWPIKVQQRAILVLLLLPAVEPDWNRWQTVCFVAYCLLLQLFLCLLDVISSLHSRRHPMCPGP